MALAQVVYQISTDADFAAFMRRDPKHALAEKGWILSKEELAFLMTVLKRETFDKARIVHLSRSLAMPWRQ